MEHKIRRFKVEDNVQERMERIVCAYECVVCVRCVLIAEVWIPLGPTKGPTRLAELGLPGLWSPAVVRRDTTDDS